MFRTTPVQHQERFVQAVFADLVCAVIRGLLDTSSRWTAYILQDDTRSIQYPVSKCPTGKDNTYI